MLPVMVVAQGSVPAVSSVDLSESEIRPGAIVSFQDTEDQYRYSSQINDRDVFGVVSVRPPLYVEIATTTVPVILDGIGFVLVTDSNGVVQRGDLLRSSARTGTAERSTEPDDFVFAVALEASSADSEAQGVLADISPTRAQAIQERRAVTDEELTDEDDMMTADAIAATTARIVVALGIAVGSLVFILYTYRSIWVTGVTAVGRNPRARRSVLLMNIASSILILLLAVFVVVVALGVLVVSV